MSMQYLVRQDSKTLRTRFFRQHAVSFLTIASRKSYRPAERQRAFRQSSSDAILTLPLAI